MLKEIVIDISKQSKLKILNLIIINISLILLFSFLTNSFLFREDMLYSGKAAEMDLSEQDLQLARSFFDLVFVYAYISTVIKFLIHSLLVSIMLYFAFLGNDKKLSFQIIYRNVLIAEFIFLFPAIIKFLWFSLIEPYASLREMNFFAPLSLVNFFGIENLKGFELILYAKINVFEILFAWFLALLLTVQYNLTFKKSLIKVFLTCSIVLVLNILWIYVRL